MSEPVGKIYSLIPKIMREVGAIGKNGVNDYDKYNFRSIDDVYNSLQPVLASNGVFFLPTVLESHENQLTSSQGKSQIRVKLRVKYLVYADDGSMLEAIVEGEAIDRSDKATNKALTAAFKYMLIQVFCIAVKGMDDPDSESPDIGKKSAAAKPAQTKQNNPLKKSDDPADYVPTFGKYGPNRRQKTPGTPLKDIDRYQLRDYCDFILSEAEREQKPIKGQVREFLEKAGEYLIQFEPRRPANARSTDVTTL